MSNDIKFTGFKKTLLTIQPYVAGGTGACFAAVCIHPIDLVKVRIQVHTDKKVSAIKIAKEVIAKEGLSKLYAGLSASIMRQAVYGTARLGLHRTFSEMIKKKNGGKISLFQKTMSGLVSGMLAGIIGNPFDLSLVRMQADGMKPLEQRRGYKNVFDAVFRIAKDEGIFTWWRGCFPMILRAMAMNAGMLAAFDQSKEFFLKMFGSGLTTDLCASAVAGLSCAFFSLPFDMMKTRLMNMKPNAEGVMPYKGIMDVFIKIYKLEGPLAFWKGFVTYYCRCAPHSMIILITMESITRTYERVCFGRVISK